MSEPSDPKYIRSEQQGHVLVITPLFTQAVFEESSSSAEWIHVQEQLDSPTTEQLIVDLGEIPYFGSTVLVGLAGSRKTKDIESFLVGDRNLPWWAILGSIVAMETSGATVLSVPGQGAGPVGMKFLQIALGYIIGRAIIVYVLLPLYFRGQLLTAYEVLNERFGGLTRRAAREPELDGAADGQHHQQRNERQPQ